MCSARGEGVNLESLYSAETPNDNLSLNSFPYDMYTRILMLNEWATRLEGIVLFAKQGLLKAS